MMSNKLQHKLFSMSKARSHCVRRHLHAHQETVNALHWHNSSTSQLCIYDDGPELALGTKRKWLRPRRDQDVCLPRSRRWQFFSRRDRDDRDVRCVL